MEYTKGGSLAENGWVTDYRNMLMPTEAETSVVKAAIALYAKEAGLTWTLSDFNIYKTYLHSQYYLTKSPLTESEYKKIIALHVKHKGTQLTGHDYNPAESEQDVFIQLQLLNGKDVEFYFLKGKPSNYSTQHFFAYRSGVPKFAEGGSVGWKGLKYFPQTDEDAKIAYELNKKSFKEKHGVDGSIFVRNEEINVTLPKYVTLEYGMLDRKKEKIEKDINDIIHKITTKAYKIIITTAYAEGGSVDSGDILNFAPPQIGVTPTVRLVGGTEQFANGGGVEMSKEEFGKNLYILHKDYADNFSKGDLIFRRDKGDDTSFCLNITYQMKHKGQIMLSEGMIPEEYLYSATPQSIEIAYKYQKGLVAAAEAEEIHNNYEGKTAEQVWDSWTIPQRKHFIFDHFNEQQKAWLWLDAFYEEKGFNDLPKKVQDTIEQHLKMGQYAKGGEVPEIAGKINEVLKHYMIAALWSSNDEDEQPFDSNYSIEDIDPQTVESMRLDVIKFLTENRAVLDFSKLSDEQIGHDFWLTRNGHGAGFWDRGLGKSTGDKLSEAAKAFGECSLYAENGKVKVDPLSPLLKKNDKYGSGGSIYGRNTITYKGFSIIQHDGHVEIKGYSTSSGTFFQSGDIKTVEQAREVIDLALDEKNIEKVAQVFGKSAHDIQKRIVYFSDDRHNKSLQTEKSAANKGVHPTDFNSHSDSWFDDLIKYVKEEKEIDPNFHKLVALAKGEASKANLEGFVEIMESCNCSKPELKDKILTHARMVLKNEFKNEYKHQFGGKAGSVRKVSAASNFFDSFLQAVEYPKLEKGGEVTSTYKGQTITKLFPSGYYEFYSDKQERFVKSDTLSRLKGIIDEEVKHAKGGEVHGKSYPYHLNSYEILPIGTIVTEGEDSPRPYLTKGNYGTVIVNKPPHGDMLYASDKNGNPLDKGGYNNIFSSRMLFSGIDVIGKVELKSVTKEIGGEEYTYYLSGLGETDSRLATSDDRWKAFEKHADKKLIAKFNRLQNNNDHEESRKVIQDWFNKQVDAKREGDEMAKTEKELAAALDKWFKSADLSIVEKITGIVIPAQKRYNYSELVAKASGDKLNEARDIWAGYATDVKLDKYNEATGNGAKELLEWNKAHTYEAGGEVKGDRYWGDFYEIGYGHGEIPDSVYFDFKVVYRDAMKFYNKKKGKTDFKNFQYIGVNGGGDEFAIIHIDKNYLESMQERDFKDKSHFDAWIAVAKKVLETGKPQKGKYSEAPKLENGGSVGATVFTKDNVEVEKGSNKYRGHVFYDEKGIGFQCLGYFPKLDDCIYINLKTGKDVVGCMDGFYYNDPTGKNKYGKGNAGSGANHRFIKLPEWVRLANLIKSSQGGKGTHFKKHQTLTAKKYLRDFLDSADDKMEKGGHIAALRRFTESDFDKLMDGDKFYADSDGQVWYIHEYPLSDDKIDTNALAVWTGIDDITPRLKLLKTTDNPLIDWLAQNKYLTAEEVESRMGNGGMIDKSLYVAWSSWFDNHPYDVAKIKSIVEAAGGKEVHTENQYGWNNQPEVVVFRGDKEIIEKALQEDLGTEWIIINEKDWKTKKHEEGGLIADDKFEKGGRVASGIEQATDLMPSVIAETAARRVILEKYEYLKKREEKEGIKNPLTEEMLQPELDFWIAYLVKKAEHLFQVNEKFRKAISAEGNKGRDTLYMWMYHWMGVQDERVFSNQLAGGNIDKSKYAHRESAQKWLDSVEGSKTGKGEKFEKGGDIECASGEFDDSKMADGGSVDDKVKAGNPTGEALVYPESAPNVYFHDSRNHSVPTMNLIWLAVTPKGRISKHFHQARLYRNAQFLKYTREQAIKHLIEKHNPIADNVKVPKGYAWSNPYVQHDFWTEIEVDEDLLKKIKEVTADVKSRYKLSKVEFDFYSRSSNQFEFRTENFSATAAKELMDKAKLVYDPERTYYLEAVYALNKVKICVVGDFGVGKYVDTIGVYHWTNDDKMELAPQEHWKHYEKGGEVEKDLRYSVTRKEYDEILKDGRWGGVRTDVVGVESYRIFHKIDKYIVAVYVAGGDRVRLRPDLSGEFLANELREWLISHGCKPIIKKEDGGVMAKGGAVAKKEYWESYQIHATFKNIATAKKFVSEIEASDISYSILTRSGASVLIDNVDTGGSPLQEDYKKIMDIISKLEGSYNEKIERTELEIENNEGKSAFELDVYPHTKVTHVSITRPVEELTASSLDKAIKLAKEKSNVDGQTVEIYDGDSFIGTASDGRFRYGIGYRKMHNVEASSFEKGGGLDAGADFESAPDREPMGDYFIIKNLTGNDGSFRPFAQGGLPFYVIHKDNPDAVLYKADNSIDAVDWIDQRIKNPVIHPTEVKINGKRWRLEVDTDNTDNAVFASNDANDPTGILSVEEVLALKPELKAKKLIAEDGLDFYTVDERGNVLDKIG